MYTWTANTILFPNVRDAEVIIREKNSRLTKGGTYA